MPTKPSLTETRAGDWIECRGVHGQAPRKGEITEVLGHDDHEHYRVRWDEKHESIVYPADGVIVTPGPGRRGPWRRPQAPNRVTSRHRRVLPRSDVDLRFSGAEDI